MANLFIAELQRFRVWALLAFIVHLVVLGFFARLVDPLQQPALVYQLTAAVYALLGLLLGLYQMGGYRRPSTWLNLLHRPVAHPHIALALSAAAIVLLASAIVLPLAIMLIAQDGLTARVVDWRHWGLPVAAVSVAIASYLAAAFAMLAPRRIALFGLVLPALILASTASGIWALLLQFCVIIWLAVLLLAVFKPDLTAPPRPLLVEVMAALPVQMGVWMLLVVLSLLYQTGWMVLGSHPLNSTPPAGGMVEASRSDGKALLLAGLAVSSHPQAPLWREQVAISEVYSSVVQIEEFAQRHQLTNPMPMEFDDKQRRRWIFSHDDMRFQGISLSDGKPAGVLGIGAANNAFALPPLPLSTRALATAQGIFAFSEDSQQIHPRVLLPAGETLASLPAAAGESMTLLSDRALYFFDARKLKSGDQLIEATQRLPLPGAIAGLAGVELIELLDGHLLSLLYGRGSIDGPGLAYQQLLWVDGEGRIETVARRELAPDFPMALRHYDWWTSPLLHTAKQLLRDLFAQASPLAARDLAPRPPAMQAWAGTLLLLSLLVAIWLSARQGLSGPRRWFWIINCGAVGLPALIALRLMHVDRVTGDA